MTDYAELARELNGWLADEYAGAFEARPIIEKAVVALDHLSAENARLRAETIEECAKIADGHSSALFGHDDPIAVKFWHAGEAYAGEEIAASIRAALQQGDKK